MFNQVKCLWWFALIFGCSAEYDDCREEDPKIVAPENCSISDGDGYLVQYLTCPDFKMTMSALTDSNWGSLPHEIEYESRVECNSNTLPYKYLRLTKSKRNSLRIYCQVPESGSIGEGWPELVILKIINSGQIGPFKREHFSGLDKLRTLLFWPRESNHKMPDDLFADLGKLTKLSLEVKHVNQNVFKDLKELERLEIEVTSTDGLNNFNASEVKNAVKLKRLTLRMMTFQRMNKQFFEGFSSIETLIFKDNKVEAIDANAFELLTSLKAAYFAFNKWNSLPSGLFSKNEKLETVVFDGDCQLATLPSGLFSNLPNLREIGIYCALTSIPNDLIASSTNLEKLDLRSNELRSLPRDLLYNHTKLKEIQLDGNDFSELPNDHFYNKSNLTEIFFIPKKDRSR